jgi:hypothetical protein
VRQLAIVVLCLVVPQVLLRSNQDRDIEPAFGGTTAELTSCTFNNIFVEEHKRGQLISVSATPKRMEERPLWNEKPN